jgi:hypothetical protein
MQEVLEGNDRMRGYISVTNDLTINEENRLSGENIEVVRSEGLRNYIIEYYLRSMISIQTFFIPQIHWS